MSPQTFPIIDNEIRSVPWVLMAPHGAAALVNHGQTLAQLANRGGLSPAEAVAIIEDRRYMVMPLHTARDLLAMYVKQFALPVGEPAPPAQPDRKALAEAIDLAKDMRHDATSRIARYQLNKLITLLERV